MVKTKPNGGLYVLSKPHGRKPKPKEETRPYKCAASLNEMEYKQLHKLAELKGCTTSEYIRSLIAKEYARI